MTNIIATITGRIENRLKETKEPCKNYATKKAAEIATAKKAQEAANHFAKSPDGQHSARYVVFYVESWKRWVGAIDLTELLNRKTSTGGYLGFCIGFYTY